MSKDVSTAQLFPQTRDEILTAYPLKLADGRAARRRQLRKNGKNAKRADRPTLWYRLTAPDGEEVYPVAPEGWEGRWVLKQDEWARRSALGLTEWIKRDYGWVPYYIEIAPPEALAPWSTLWDDVGQTRQAKARLSEILGRDTEFETPKPVRLIERVLAIGATPDALVLDSFAGSGTTAHAVLKANAADHGSRRFILVEGEDYADRLTAERVRRVIAGYAWQGTQKVELLNEKLTWTQLQKADQLLAKVEAIKVREGFADGDLADRGAASARRFDRIAARVADGALVVEGERRIEERAPGTGGEFTYCTLGEPLDVEKMLSGESLPDFRELGAWLFHTATGATLPPAASGAPEWYLAEALDRHVWLVYRPEVAFLKSPDAALTLSLARRIGAWSRERGDKKSLVFAPAKYLSNRQLADEGVEFAALPFALYREA
jgi:adenine-specific DNA-methyltransferase